MKSTNKPFFTMIILFYLVFGICDLSFCIMIHLPVERLTREADAIIHGEVKNIQSRWSMDGNTILTTVELQVDEILKGNVTNNYIVFQFPGGEVGEIGLKVEDMPSFKINENIIVFLKSIQEKTNVKNSPIIAMNIFQVFNLFGAAQGKFSIDENRLARRTGYSILKPEADEDNEISISELKSRIRIAQRIYLKKR